MKRSRYVRRLGFGVVYAAAIVLLVVRWVRPHSTLREASDRAERTLEQPRRLQDTRWSSIAGSVTDTAGRPVGKSRVCAVDTSSLSGSGAGTCVETDTQGHYRVQGLPPSRYLVTAARAGYVTGAALEGRPVDLGDAEPRSGVDIVLQAGGARVTGVVVDATGGPLPHASVRAERMGVPRLAVDLEADDAGAFTLWFPPGQMILSASAAAYAPAHWSGRAPSVDVRLVLIPGATLRGTVISAADGRPVSNIEVRTMPPGGRVWPPPRRATSNAEGAFDVHGLEPGSYTLVAAGDGWLGELALPAALAIGSVLENLRVEVRAAAQVAGRVLLENRQPCEQGSVTLGPPDFLQSKTEAAADLLSNLTKVPAITASIGPAGAVRFPAVAEGRYHVAVRCSNNVLRDGPRLVDVVGTQAVSGLTWKVGPGARLTILTADERDQAVPEAEFFVRLPTGVTMPGNTNAEGRYDFSGELYPGTYEVTSGRAFQTDPVRVALREGDDPVIAKLTIAGNASIVTNVTARGGGPLDGLVVTAVARPDPVVQGETSKTGPRLPPSANTLFAIALGEGRYRITPVKPGRYDVRVDDGANASVHEPCTVVAGQVAPVSIELDRGGRIRGRVIDDEGVPVPDTWVGASAENDRDPDRPPIVQRMLATASRTMTDGDGHFVLEHLTGGDTTYDLRAEQATATVAVKNGVKVGDADVAIVLHAAATVAGTVAGDCVDPAAPMTLVATSPATGQSIPQNVAAADRSFVVRVAPGHVDLAVFCRGGGGMARMGVDVSPKEQLTGLRLELDARTLASATTSRANESVASPTTTQ